MPALQQALPIERKYVSNFKIMKKQIFITVLLVQILLLNTSQIAAQNNFTPEWSKGIVWYQIFPERFNNGDPDNDPKVIDQNGRILLTTHQFAWQ